MRIELTMGERIGSIKQTEEERKHDISREEPGLRKNKS